MPAGASFIEGDIRDAAKWLDSTFDGVLHFAAFSQVGESVVKPEKYWDNNVGGTMALLEAMRGAGVRRLVFSSTAATYGEPEQVPILESAPTRPTNPYGASKLAVDHMISGRRPPTAWARCRCATSTSRAPTGSTASATTPSRT